MSKDIIKAYVWLTQGYGGRNTVHYLVMWGDHPMFYDNTGSHAWPEFVKLAQAHVETLQHLKISGRKMPKPYPEDCISLPPVLDGYRRPWIHMCYSTCPFHAKITVRRGGMKYDFPLAA